MVGNRMRELRQQKGYSISELADLAGVSKSYLSYIERDIQKNPSLQFLQKIAITLETDIEYLLGNQSNKNSANSIDDEWKKLLKRAIDEGMSKDDFINFREYLKYKKWNNKKSKL
ncbi:helix-turn-helix domain-containing protein [Metabacillus arenae]|uniref:Helix-turn-helix domain-containing protein n=1 Tax=Metabacillus arenae TaxID=2771434 RepID=A0A926RW70_9BACI|nr:helix-turn-helix transcriptional regulator [Metabacillus arenae]MBD1378872.1 helix-turn-helix domain-containing protein [Metabacillus arenae]